MEQQKKAAPRILVYGRRDTLPDSYKKINVTSKSSEAWQRALSPFFLGPVQVYPDGDENAMQCVIMENAWQYLKHYEWQSDEEWRAWSQEGFQLAQANRFPFGFGHKAEYSVWKGQKLQYIEARVKIYIPLYVQAVETHAAKEFAQLKEIYEKNKHIALFDFDGHCDQLFGFSYEDTAYNVDMKLGHAFILAAMLQGDRFWERPYDESRVFGFKVDGVKPYLFNNLTF